MVFHESDLSKSSFEEAFMFDDLVIVEKTTYPSEFQNPTYVVYGFARTAEADHKSFSAFKKFYIDSYFSVRYFFNVDSYVKGATETIYFYHRNCSTSDISYSYDYKRHSILFSVDPYSCKLYPERVEFIFNLSGRNMNIIDKVNLLIVFDISSLDT